MAKHTTTETTTDDKPAPTGAEAPRQHDGPVKAASTEKIQADADKGKPHPHAQIEVTQQPTLSSSLAEGLAGLPQLSQLDGVRANATYYLGAGREELVKLLEGLPIPPEDKHGLAARDAVVAHAKAGHFTSR